MCVQTALSGHARGHGEIALGGAFFGWKVYHTDFDALSVELSLELGIVNVAFDLQFTRLSIKRAIRADLPTS